MTETGPAVMGRKIDAVSCGEAGGINSATPFVVAAASGSPLIDGDGMGREYSGLPVVTLTLHGVSATPMVMCDDKGKFAGAGHGIERVDKTPGAVGERGNGRVRP